LSYIFDVIGTPEADDFSIITDEKAIQYLKSFDYREKVELDRIYPGSNSTYLSIIGQNLTFNPDKRMPIEDILNHTYFNDVRDHERESMIPEIPRMEFEEIEDITMEQLRGFFVAIVDRFNVNSK
jgi:hypothetical protein